MNNYLDRARKSLKHYFDLAIPNLPFDAQCEIGQIPDLIFTACVEKYWGNVETINVLDDLMQRVEALEAENKKLRKSLE